MKRIYVAGKLNDMSVGYVHNLRTMIVAAEEIRQLGFAIYVPGIDFLMGLVNGYESYEDYFDNSQPFLDVCDAVFVLPNWETSRGTKWEIERAHRKGIPVYFNVCDLMKGEADEQR